MSKDDILQQLAAVVEDTMSSYKGDFYRCDKSIIETEAFKFPIIWIVGECHTHMFQLGNYKDDFFASESFRYDYTRNHNPWDYFFKESLYAKDKWFLVTEDGLHTINLGQAKAAIMDYVTPAVNAWVEENGPLPNSLKVPVKIQGITLSELKALIADCRAHGNDSLFECFKRRQKACRVADDQYTVISYHKHWHEFTFCEYINGKEGLAGHIVFHGWPETGYQTNGAVQLDPKYGWSSHT